MHEKTLFSAIIIAIIALTSATLFFWQQTADAQKQTRELQNQIAQYESQTDRLTYYQNLTESLQNQLDANQAQVADLENLTETLQNQTANLQTQISNQDQQNSTYVATKGCNVTITAITQNPWDVVYTTPYFKDFNISIQNVGTVNAGGFTFRFTIEGNTTNIDSYYISISPSQLGVLHVQETKTVHLRMITPRLDMKGALSECTLSVQLMLDDTVLDEYKQPIGP